MSLRSSDVDHAVRRLDAWRRSPLAEVSEQGSYKEWFHFCVRLPGNPPGHLLVNFNVTERNLPSGNVRAARVITLAHLGEWCGHVDTIPDAEVRGTAGGLDLRFGKSSVRLESGVFALKVRSKQIEADLRLRPMMLPTGTTSVCLGEGHAMHWVAVARLSAEGTVSIGNTRLRCEGAPSYHDHNWGQFRWGSDLAWEWGFVHPNDVRNPWSVVFVRVSDGSRHRTLNQFALVWKADVYSRAFLNQELSIAGKGSYTGPRPLTLPGVMRLLVAGDASGVPGILAVRARGLGDELAIDYHTSSGARVAMPSDVHAFRNVLLNETEGAARVRGSVGGEEFEFDGNGIVELVRG